MSEDEAQICIWPKIFTRHMVLDIFRNPQLTMLKTGSRQRNANAAVGQAAHGKLVRKSHRLCASKCEHSHWSIGCELQLLLADKSKTNL